MAVVSTVMPSDYLAGQELDEAATACLACHAANPENPATGIVAATFAASVHASLGCRMCHSTGYAGFPHTATEEQKAGDCTACHRGSGEPYHFSWIANEVKASIHGRMVSEDFACTECHDPHAVLPVHRATDMRAAIAAVNQGCLHCHGQDDEAAQESERHSLGHLIEVHSFLPQLERHANSARCVECHTPGREQTVHLILSANSAVRDCVECHTANSAMLEKFYRHMAEEDRQTNFVNSVILNNYYMVGATQNRRLDKVMWGLFGVSLLGIVIHGAARLVTGGARS
jgi:hypothetical protein